MGDCKERPIIFNTEMVKAILEDRKFQTRRVIKNVPTGLDEEFLISKMRDMVIKQYGDIGDRLYVREAWCIDYFTVDHTIREDSIIYYRASGEKPERLKWKPSIHMPKTHARTWLEIIDIRVEKIKDISYCDAQSEGLYKEFDGTKWWYAMSEDTNMNPSPILVFKELWDSINLKRGYGWNFNPWIGVIEFKRIEK